MDSSSPCTGGNLGSFVFAQDVYTAGFFEAHSLWIFAFMAVDKLHWLPIHSLMVMFHQLHCRSIFSMLPAHSWPGVKNILSWLLSQFMPGNALPLVGNCYMYLIVFANTNQIHAFLWFSIQIHKISVFKYKCKYVFEPNPVVNIPHHVDRLSIVLYTGFLLIFSHQSFQLLLDALTSSFSCCAL